MRAALSCFGSGLSDVRAALSCFGSGLSDVRAALSCFGSGLSDVRAAFVSLPVVTLINHDGERTRMALLEANHTFINAQITSRSVGSSETCRQKIQ